MKDIKITIENARQMKESGIEYLVELAKTNFPELFDEEKKWIEIGEISGYYVDTDSDINEYSEHTADYGSKNISPTEKEAKSTLALSQLRQWRDKANGEKLEDWADWESTSKAKYAIIRRKKDLYIAIVNFNFNELVFKTVEIAGQFLKDHKTLLKEYYIIDEK